MRAGVLKFVLASILLALAWSTPGTWARDLKALETVALEGIPPQGRETYQRILQGGPFPFEKDGVVFGNRERLLPMHPRGYYREYTVKTPRVKHRGTRRIVCGGPATKPDACYYTDDHYASFRRIDP